MEGTVVTTVLSDTDIAKHYTIQYNTLQYNTVVVVAPLLSEKERDKSRQTLVLGYSANRQASWFHGTVEGWHC